MDSETTPPQWLQPAGPQRSKDRGSKISTSISTPMEAAILSRKKEKNELAGPPPTTAIREPSVKANPDSSPVASDDKESATDVCRESLIPFGFDTPRYVKYLLVDKIRISSAG